MMHGQSQQTTTILTNEVKEQITDAMNCQTRGVAERLQVHRSRDCGTSVVEFRRPGFREFEISLVPENGEPVDASVERLAQFLKDNKATVVRQFVFGSVAAHVETMRAMHRAFGNIDWPVTWVEGTSCTSGPIAGMQAHAVAGASVRTLKLNERVVGRVFDDGEVKHCLIGDFGPAQATASAPEQARETFENLEATVGQAGMTMSDVVRTWFFLDDILSWYGPFNEARNGFFARCGLRQDRLPASTGVAGKNPRGTALVVGAWAIKPRKPGVQVQTVPSPAQCAATRYGSAFSRAVEIVWPSHRRLLISGTASVGPDGQTAHTGDAGRQIELTMDVVAAILRSRGMAFADVVRATAYLKSPVDFPLFAAWCARNKQEALPVVSACCDLCRPDLLFEIELDAARCL